MLTPHLTGGIEIPPNGTLHAGPTKGALRLLATSDLHMHILGYDYVTDTAQKQNGLSRVAPLIHTARQEARAAGMACLLVDNGDMLQGTALGDHVAHGCNDDNPICAVIDALGYDALGLGNHDFDYGLEYLAGVMRGFEMPVLSANVTCDALPALRPYVILPRGITTSDGQTETVRIGVVSVLPQQTEAWNRNHLAGRAQVGDAIDVLHKIVPQMRAEGADVVVALAHMGIAQSYSEEDHQNAALKAAQIPGVDAIIAGHTHIRFPDAEHPALDGVDVENGTLFGVPTALPGAGGADLVVIDLHLSQARSGQWQVDGHRTALRPVLPDSAEDETILRLAAPAHTATRAHLAQPVGELTRGINTYFALAQPSPVPALVAAAKRRAIKKQVRGTDLAHLPILAAAAAPATGGMSGPSNFVALDRGAVLRRHIAGLSPYPNQVWGLRVTGSQIENWLERSARLFHTLTPDRPDQYLVDRSFAGFRFDALYGLQYRFDPTGPARFDHTGALLDPSASRVRDLTWRGAPIDPDQEFLVAATHFRASGGGGFETYSEDAIVVQTETMLETALLDYLASGEEPADPFQRPWSFEPNLNRSAILCTTPDATAHLDDIAHLQPEVCGTTPDGFINLRLHL